MEIFSKFLCSLNIIQYQNVITLLSFLIVSWNCHHVDGGSYSNVTQLYADKLGASSGYNTAVRPLLDQSQTINVTVNFSIIAIAEVDNIKQAFIVNGFLTFTWIDEILAWDPYKYDHVYAITPYPNQIWRPRTVLANTLDARDLFEDDYAPTAASYTGQIVWLPAAVFPTSCKLNLRKYPFDFQRCSIDLYSMDTVPGNIAFNTPGSMSTFFYTENGEWEIVDSSIETGVILGGVTYLRVEFLIKRRPGFFVMNIVMPVVLLSLLNIMVFLIPVESGEKISYGITVLLALAVFMSVISEMLPRSSDIMPLVTIYLMALLAISVSTVIVAIVIVYLHHREEKETVSLRAKSAFKGVFNKVKILNMATAHTKHNNHMPPVETAGESNVNEEDRPSVSNRSPGMFDVVTNLRNLKKTAPGSAEPGKEKLISKHHVNKYRIIGKHIDFFSFIIFMTIWVAVTFGFLLAMSA